METANCPLCCITTGSAVTPFERLFPDLAREDQIVAESPLALVAVDVAPIGLGHCIVITRAHRLSMADCPNVEAEEVDRLIVTMSELIRRVTGLPFVAFEHGQRSEDDHPFGCSIAHAHIHVVATKRASHLDLGSIIGVDFQPYRGRLADIDDVALGKHYLFVRNTYGQAWLANPSKTASQLLRRHFLDADTRNRELKWNWSDQALLSHKLETRERVLGNLAILSQANSVGVKLGRGT